MMDGKSLDSLKKWFEEYVRSFRSDNKDYQKNIDIKTEHSRKVCEAIREIGLSLRLNEKELNLAEAAALFHDIGRFEQFRQYKTFSDHHSVNHAELGVKVLQEKNVLQGLGESAKKIVLRAVSNHNRFAIPDGESEPVRFYSRLLRDADKLDIYRVVSEHYDSGKGNGVSLGLPDTPGVSDAVYRNLMKGKLVLMSHLRNVNDFKLLQIGWIYDVYFMKTLELVRERGYLEKIRDTLPACKEVFDIYSAVVSHIRKKSEQNNLNLNKG